ncbi:COQ9 family protein [Alkalicaulis satelles]|uniref:COQ9 family protein n=1 Tax=Alkalicaulis satelles TaxID=2609175 RepID=A0A5M6ZFN6_9PROT|nr:COQ9 family protein [Alkalicaulis satelles]KAA5803539.1 COQ9 family protein [Alkalicaulis satelles]
MSQTATPRADAARNALVDAALIHAGFDGWTAATLARAGADAGLSAGEVELYCPGGVLDLIETWFARCDDAAAAAIAADPAGKVRARVTNGVMARLDAMAGHEDAARRARARLLLPDGLDRGARLVWATADMIWRALGDPSTDGNFYSKRAILSGVYASTLAVWLDEDDPAKPRTRAFLDRRIANVMEFEKVKAGWRKAQAGFPDLFALAGRARYGARSRP